MPTLRTDLPKQSNAETVIKDLDTVGELCEAAVMRIASYHSRLANIYSKRVKPRMLQPGDMVLRKVFKNTANPSAEKFYPNWEGPYIVTRPEESGSYALDKLDGTPIPRMWNVMHLKRYYQYRMIQFLTLLLSQMVHYKVRARLMSYRSSMVDAQLVHYKVRVRLMSYRPSMVDVQLVHHNARARKQ